MRLLSILISLLLINQICSENQDMQLQLSQQQNDNQINEARLFGSLKESPKKQEQKAKSQSPDYNNLFNSLSVQNRNKRPNMESFLFKQMQKNMLNQMSKSTELPYEALLPRRRMPLQIGQIDQNSPLGNEVKKLKQNPLEDLLKILNKNEGKQKQKVNWQNPNFKDRKGGQQLPFSKIFGNKKKNKHEEKYIQQSQIEPLLISQIPFLKGGKIVDMTSNHYRKGTFLNIEFETKQQKLYTIIARYRIKTKHLEIVSLKENTSAMKQAEEESKEQESEINNEPVQKQSQIKEEAKKDKQEAKQVQNRPKTQQPIKIKDKQSQQKKQDSKTQVKQSEAQNKKAKAQKKHQQNQKPQEQKPKQISKQQPQGNLSQSNEDNIVKQ